MTGALSSAPSSLVESRRTWCESYLPKCQPLKDDLELLALCEIHDDKHPSLWVGLKLGQFACRACGAKGSLSHYARQTGKPAPPTDFVPPERPVGGAATTDFVYRDTDGTPLLKITRTDKRDGSKSFYQNRKDQNGAWVKGGLNPSPLFMADRLASAPAGSTVFIVEGEKAAAAGIQLGLLCTTAPEGAGKFGKVNPEHVKLLAHLQVFVLPDLDEPGAAHAQQIIAHLAKHGVSASLLELPGLPPKGDLFDFIAARNGTARTEIERLVEESISRGLRSTRSTAICGDLERSTAIYGENAEEDDEDDDLEAEEEVWPELHPAALHGIAGRFVRMIEPHSETDPVALLLTFLACVGHIVTSRPHFQTEADRQTGALYLCLVGKSSRGRKGSSLGWIEKIFHAMLTENPHREDDLRLREIRGLASGEGLIERMRDPEGYNGEHNYNRERLLVIETEFAGILQRMGREGSILSPILRQGWDGKPIENPTKSSPARVSHPHLSVIGHVTKFELHKLFAETDVHNGLGNRFLWACVKRSKFLPIGGQPSDDDVNALADELASTVCEAQKCNRLHFGDEADEMWRAVYAILEDDNKPISAVVDALTSRSAAQVVRLSLIYAVLDRSYTIQAQHLLAGLAVWSYCEQSVSVLHRSPRRDLDSRLLRALRDSGQDGLTKTELNKALGGRAKTDQVESILGKLKSGGFVKQVKVPAPARAVGGKIQGRTSSKYFYVEKASAGIREFIEQNWDPTIHGAQSYDASTGLTDKPEPAVRGTSATSKILGHTSVVFTDIPLSSDREQHVSASSGRRHVNVQAEIEASAVDLWDA